MTAEILHYLPTDFEMWRPAWQAGVIFASTLVLEDVAAIGAGLLLATGVLSWPLAFGACFLGIWIGDAGLYGLARIIGRSGFERSALRRFADRVDRSERWFAARGSSILVFSRLVPGARLPTYLAAGFLRLPLRRFLAITGAASLAWTGAILLMTQLLGVKLLAWVGPFRETAWVLGLSIGLAFVVLRLARKFAGQKGHRLRAWLQRWCHWEFWPTWVFYPPVALYCVWLAVRYRSLTLPTAANPGIFSGGIIGESKMATLKSLMETSFEFTAEADLLTGSTPNERFDSLRGICDRRGFDYPFILKPDFGQRGVGVKLVRSEEQARAYLAATGAPLIVQRYAPGREVGVFYYREPHETSGHIFAITDKIFPVVTGDGQSTISDLIWADSRARFLAEKYLKRFKGRESEVLAPGQSLKLVEAGNHAQGCIFRDGHRFATPELVGCIDEISRKVPGFFIGRYDIRYSSEVELKAGRNFKIIELNGAAAEATSIYDSRNSIFTAYRTLFRQWDLVFAIGAANRRRGHAPMKIAALCQNMRDYGRHAVTYPPAD